MGYQRLYFDTPAKTNQSLDKQQLWTVANVAKYYGLNVNTIKQLIASYAMTEYSFPSPVFITPNRIKYDRLKVKAWFKDSRKLMVDTGLTDVIKTDYYRADNAECPTSNDMSTKQNTQRLHDSQAGQSNEQASGRQLEQAGAGVRGRMGSAPTIYTHPSIRIEGVGEGSLSGLVIKLGSRVVELERLVRELLDKLGMAGLYCGEHKTGGECGNDKVNGRGDFGISASGGRTSSGIKRGGGLGRDKEGIGNAGQKGGWNEVTEVGSGGDGFGITADRGIGGGWEDVGDRGAGGRSGGGSGAVTGRDSFASGGGVDGFEGDTGMADDIPENGDVSGVPGGGSGERSASFERLVASGVMRVCGRDGCDVIIGDNRRKKYCSEKCRLKAGRKRVVVKRRASGRFAEKSFYRYREAGERLMGWIRGMDWVTRKDIEDWGGVNDWILTDKISDGMKRVRFDRLLAAMTGKYLDRKDDWETRDAPAGGFVKFKVRKWKAKNL